MRSRKVRPLPPRIASMVLWLQLALGILIGASSVDARSPTPLFDFRPAGYARAGSLAVAGRVAVGAAPAGILLFDAATGALLTVIRVPWNGSAIPLTLSSNDSIATGHEIGHVYAFDTGTGALRWGQHAPRRQSTFGQSLAGDGPDLVVTGSCSMPTA